VIESTGTYHCRLACLLYERDITLSVVNPLSAKRFGQALMQRNKTDKPDSHSLMRYGQLLQPAGWKPNAQVEIQQLLQHLLSRYEKQQGVWRNQLEAITYPAVQNRYVTAKLTVSPEQVAGDIEEIENQLKQLIMEHEATAYKHLQSIPGIGPKTAVTSIAVTGKISIRRNRYVLISDCARVLSHREGV
ncbi:MAG: transposase, partial [Dysgonamonadaceae bacterium]|jgi:transposase|nr:transposase [Dysgonamonadaceae bacterium]